MNMKITNEEVLAIESVQNKIHSQAVAMGWYKNPREDGTLIALCHSELSEALEGLRKNLMDDHLSNRPMAEVELADTIIRILDFAGYKGYDVAGAIADKLEYNKNRTDHQLENREKEGGKAF